MKMFMEYWWKDTDWLKQKYSQKNVSQYHFQGTVSERDRRK